MPPLGIGLKPGDFGTTEMVTLTCQQCQPSYQIRRRYEPKGSKQ